MKRTLMTWALLCSILFQTVASAPADAQSRFLTRAAFGGGQPAGTTIPVPAAITIAARYWAGGGPIDQGNAAAVFSGASATNTIGTTLVDIEVQGEFTEVQLILANMSTTQTIEYVGASAVAVSDFTDKRQDALFATEAKTFAFGQSSPTITVPVRSGRNSPSLALSDWITIAAKPRTDGATAPAGSKRSDGSLPFLLYVRLAQVIHDGTATRRATYGQRSGAEWSTGRSQIWSANNTGAPTANLTGAFAQTPVAQNSGFTGYATLAGIRYRSKTKVMTVMMGGSSMVEGGSDTLKTTAGLQRAVNDASTAARPVEAVNMGMSTNTSTNARIGMQYAVPIIQPSHVLWEFWNPNDVGGGNLTQAQMDTINATLETNRGLVFTAAEAIGAIGFVYDGFPRSANASTSWYGSSQDSWRLAYLAALQNRSFIAAQVNAAMTDGATPQRFRVTANGFAADESTDFLHPTTPGYVAAKVPVTAAINSLAGSYFP